MFRSTRILCAFGLFNVILANAFVQSIGYGQGANLKTEDVKASVPFERLDSVDFERHVAPLLGRHGCNSAACHGAFGGKGGLQLTLFGYSAKRDYQNLCVYIDTDEPESSLLLQKPTGIEEHAGGIRFETDSQTYQMLVRWINSGANWKSGSGEVTHLLVEPSEVVFAIDGVERSVPQRLRVTARFHDGSKQDVTDFCRFTSCDEGVAEVSDDGLVRRVRHGDTAIIVSYRNEFSVVKALSPFPEHGKTIATAGLCFIDSEIVRKLNQLNISPSPPAGDADFLRRITLDTIGTIPTPDEIKRFCEDATPDKRERIIDTLLSHPMHSAPWATRMCDITKCNVEQMGEGEKTRNRRAQMWHDWFRRRFSDNVAYSEIVRCIVTATSRGDLGMGDWVKQEEELVRQSRLSFDSSYAAREFLDLYWRRLGDDGKFPLKETAELTAAAFTGVRLHCAQCHKHPFDRWTQDDYAAFTNIFAGVIFGNSTELNVAITAELERRREAKRNGEKTNSLPQIREVFVSSVLGREITGSTPDIPIHPRAFGSSDFDGKRDLRQQFYEWLVDEQNPYFARNFANRVWAAYFGVGIVDPVDDFSISNPASHPQLLEKLSELFRKSGFDIRNLEKQILMSDAYQRSSAPNASNRSDRRNFARQYVRPLLAEVALDCINKALGVTDSFGDDAPENSLAIEMGTNKPTSKAGLALKILGRGERETICDCSRRKESDLRQFLFLINDKSIHEKIRSGSINQLKSLPDEDVVAQLYLRLLARFPSAEEIEVGKSHFAEHPDRDQAFEDLVWALLNSREFITNH